MKLYPPVINNKIPAFYGNLITIPFELNKSVSINDIDGAELLVKSVENNSSVATISIAGNSQFLDMVKAQAISFTFDLESNIFIIGQYYKFQLAFKNKGETGYYSNIGVAKYIPTPHLTIEDMNAENSAIIPKANSFYLGTYSLNSDNTKYNISMEPLYSYYFNLYDEDQKTLLDTSGVLINKLKTLEDGTISQNSWHTSYNLEPYHNYYIQYGGTTLNGAEVISSPYRVLSPDTIDLDIGADFLAVLDKENGCIDLSLKPNSNFNSMIKYKFLVSRASSKNNYSTWEPIMKDHSKSFNLSISDTPNFHIWTDYTLEHGVSYIYALQAYNDNNGNKLYSNRIYSNKQADSNTSMPIFVDFEHSYLFDGQKQLKLIFNPKVSSFKNTVLESKVDTLGGKYPFFFRNAQVKYKEFPISGLISFLMDKEDKFLTGISNIELQPDNDIDPCLDYGAGDTQLTTTNIYKERLFKNEVLEWLTNGEPKIFRSPTEGNFIVRLMNTSLSPNDTVGRMLHTFSSTAYEIADYNFNNLREYGFVDIDLNITDKTMYICQKELKSENKKIDFLFPPKYIRCNALNINDSTIKLTVQYQNDKDPSSIVFNGSYTFSPVASEKIQSITFNPSSVEQEIEIIWCYETEPPSNSFSRISDIQMKEEFVQITGGGDILKQLSNIEREIGQINHLKIYRRHIEDCWYNSNDGKYYKQAEYNIEEKFEYADTLIYRIYNEPNFAENVLYWKNKYGENVKIKESSFNGQNPYQINFNGTTVLLEQNEINITNDLQNILQTLHSESATALLTENEIMTKSIKDINKLIVGIGLIVEMGYYVKEFEYSIPNLGTNNTSEDFNKYLKDKNNKDVHKTSYVLAAWSDPQKNYLTQVKDHLYWYNTYITSLEKLLKILNNPDNTIEGGGSN